MNQKKLHESEIEKMKKEKELKELQHKELALREDFFKRMITLSVPQLKHNNKGRIKLSDTDWNNISENVNVAFNGFSKRLCTRYPQLTIDDIHFCILIKMNLSIADLASLYCVEKTTIYKKKERIKKRNCLF